MFDFHYLPFAIQLRVILKRFDDKPDRPSDRATSSGLDLSVENCPVPDEDLAVGQTPRFDPIDPVVVIDQGPAVRGDLGGRGGR